MKCAPASIAGTGRTTRRSTRKSIGSASASVAINDPYKGVEIVRRHGRPAEGRHSLQIEVNRRLYMDEETLDRTKGYGELEANLGRLLEALSQYVGENGGGARGRGPAGA